MHLKRIQVPDFRVLKNVDICFEESFSPRVFPIGSQNGGGKSTLLQLVFILLHCASIPDRHPALKNTLKSFLLESESKKTLATVSIIHEDQEIELEFFSCVDSYIEHLIAAEASDKNHVADELRFSMIPGVESIRKAASIFVEDRGELERLLFELEDISNLDESERRFRFESIAPVLNRFLSDQTITEGVSYESSSLKHLQDEIAVRLNAVKAGYAQLAVQFATLSVNANKITDFLSLENLRYICNYSSTSDNRENYALLCEAKGITLSQLNSLLHEVADKIFLTAPSTQIFLFLGRRTNQLLFREEESKMASSNYYSSLEKAKSAMPGLFTYDFLELSVLIDAFKTARDRDFKEALETGAYGNAYQSLLSDLKTLLPDKQIYLSSDFSEVRFKSLSDNMELYPEDLSHGELKRLSIYMWLKYRNIKDAIVLMDEIEIALHPDWQYGIVSDLLQWSPNNQYILATHSYELCQALTPAHVKELEPKLLKQTEQSA